MDAATFSREFRDDNETPLSRLGSSKSLYALTGGEMDAGAVRTAVAAEFALAGRTFESWSADEANGDAAALFGDVAEDAREHRDTADADVDPAGDDVHEYPEYDVLADLDATAERAGGLYGRLVLAHTRTEQTVGFFVGDADPASSNEFRAVRDDLDDRLDDALDLLASVCEGDDDGDWAAARDAADAVVDAAYDDYVETLESMGVKPKNVC
ncbi:transcription antitermination protein [Halobaculum sp. CBA1158]|uniref:transcription antitermination protein n=1 Tax=Halobaculum sp. CBA1158 TaxID=2904243 RepID=UPI001F3B4638|nr:transcription antitermination protein [Halobaculum sp. CBA1158]UIO99810.1 transcription antitermination protein [Halobaculum sp. CBA1158]